MSLQDQFAKDAEEADGPVGDLTQCVTAGELLEELKEREQLLSNELKELRARMGELQDTLLPEAMRHANIVGANGKGSFTLPSGKVVYLRADMHVGVNAANHERLFAYLEERGDGALIKRTVHPGTLKSWAKDRLEDGETLPEFITAHSFTKATLRRGS